MPRAGPGDLVRVLAIDTALGACSACVSEGGAAEPIAQETILMERGHAEALLPLLDRVMARVEGGFPALDRLGGPGGCGRRGRQRHPRARCAAGPRGGLGCPARPGGRPGAGAAEAALSARPRCPAAARGPAAAAMRLSGWFRRETSASIQAL